MGGASRNEKRRRQAAADQRLAAAGIKAPTNRRAGNRTALIVVTVAVAVAVIVAVVVFVARGSAEVKPTYATTVSGAVVTAGPPSAKVVVDIYQDYLCPNCERFEAHYGNDLTTALNAGQIAVRFHAVAILDASTTPAGYSTRAANAALCSVPAGIFPAYHAALFTSQPAERSAGLTDEQLIASGTKLGATGDFAGCVRQAPNAAAVTAETQAALKNPAIQIDGAFGTPTVVVGGKRVDLNDTSWLKNAIAAG